MKLAGLLLLPAGWGIVLAAIAVLPPLTVRSAFVAAGVAVEALGMVLAIRAHIPVPDERTRERQSPERF